MNKKPSKLIIVAVFLILFGVIGLLINILFGSKTNLNLSEELTELPVESVIPVVEMNEFIYPEWNISFNYPDSWLVEEQNDELYICPKEGSKRECFTIKTESNSFDNYLNNLEKELGLSIIVPDYSTRYTNGFKIQRIFLENKISQSYMSNDDSDLNFVIISDTPWNDYGSHMEPVISESFELL